MFEFDQLAASIVTANEHHLLNDGPADQIGRIIKALTKFNGHTPLAPVAGVRVDLAGFGTAPVRFAGPEDTSYLLLSEVADALGWPIWEACKWARRQFLFDVEAQREQDEEDGTLGWECLRDLTDLGLWCNVDNPEAKPDGGGRRCSDYGDWLISDGRLMLAILDSPWGKEFMANARQAFRHGFQHASGNSDLANLPTVDSDGRPTGITLADAMQPNVSEEEAIQRARRGPGLPEEGE